MREICGCFFSHGVCVFFVIWEQEFVFDGEAVALLEKGMCAKLKILFNSMYRRSSSISGPSLELFLWVSESPLVSSGPFLGFRVVLVLSFAIQLVAFFS